MFESATTAESALVYLPLVHLVVHWLKSEAKDALQDALQGSDKPVVDSAVVALSNIEFMETIGTNEKFAKLTGG